MAFNDPTDPHVSRPTDRLVADGVGAGTSITSEPVITAANPDPDEAVRLNTARTGLSRPGAGARANAGRRVR